jgi:hypothetical protein
LSTQYKCELCETYVCKNCFEIKKERDDTTHVCDETLVKMIQELLKSSKPCPKCGQGIQKLEGCKHMFCAACKTCFDWDTGKITTSNSNPEFYKWKTTQSKLQSNPENNLEFCGVKLNEEKYNSLLKKLNITTDYLINKYNFYNISSIYNYITHIRDITMPRYRINHLDQDMLKLRVKYLLDKISDQEWKKQILMKERKNEYNTSIHNLLELVINVCQSFIIKMCECKFNSLEDFEEAWNEFYNVLIYFNDNCKEITKKYSYNKYIEFKILYSDEDCKKSISEYYSEKYSNTYGDYVLNRYNQNQNNKRRMYQYMMEFGREFHKPNLKNKSPRRRFTNRR